MPLKAWLLKANDCYDCASAATHLNRRVGHAHTPHPFWLLLGGRAGAATTVKDVPSLPTQT